MQRSIWLACVGIVVACNAAQAQLSGKAIFEGKGNCHVCHGKNARGTALAPNLTDAEWVNIDGSLAAIKALVKTGVPKPKKFSAPMPPMGGAKLKPEEIDAVAEYVFGLRQVAVTGAATAVSAPGVQSERTLAALVTRPAPVSLRRRLRTRGCAADCRFDAS